MPAPTQVDDNFRTALEKTRSWTDVASQAGLGEADWSWYAQSDQLNIDPGSIAAMATPFSREGINTAQQEVVGAGVGTLGHEMSLVLQGNYLAVMERATRLALSSRVRRACWSAARLQGQAHTQGIFTRVAQEAQDLLAQGSFVAAPANIPNNEPSEEDVAALVAAAGEAILQREGSFLQELPP